MWFSKKLFNFAQFFGYIYVYTPSVEPTAKHTQAGNKNQVQKLSLIIKKITCFQKYLQTNMRNYFTTFLFLLLTSVTACGQSNDLPKTKFTLSYFGETVSHPGLNVGIEQYPFQSHKYQLIVASNMGAYVHIRNNTSLFLRVQSGQRVTFGSGVFFDHFMGLGYLHHFTHGGDNYEVLPNGAIVKTSNTGRSMIMPSVAIGAGYDFSKKTKWQMSYFVRPELFWKAPFNGYYLTHLALNTGFVFKLNKKNER